MSAMASQITSVSIVCSTVYAGANQRKHQSSASLAFVRGIHRLPVNSVTRKTFPFDDIIMGYWYIQARKWFLPQLFVNRVWNVPQSIWYGLQNQTCSWIETFEVLWIPNLEFRSILNGLYPLWRHQMETFSALLALCVGNSPVTREFPAQRPVTRNFDVFFDLRLNKRLSKQSWGWWFETQSRSL